MKNQKITLLSLLVFYLLEMGSLFVHYFTFYSHTLPHMALPRTQILRLTWEVIFPLSYLLSPF